MKTKILLAFSIFLCCFACVNPKKYRDEMQLFQRGLDSIGTYQYNDVQLKPGDQVVIKVYTQASITQEQVAVLNMGGTGKEEGTYVVNQAGQMDLPKIGLLTVEGLTLKALKTELQKRWSPFVKDIGVNVRLEEVLVNMIGEFKSPGVKRLKKARPTLIDALAEASGFTDDGMRRDVLVIREDSGRRQVYKVDFRDAQFYNSPVFQVQQNDLIVAGISDFKFSQRSFAEFNQKVGPWMIGIGFVNLLIGIFLLFNTLN